MKELPPNLYLAELPGKGRGVFTSSAISMGSHVLGFSGKICKVEEIKDFTHYLQISSDTYLSPSGQIDDFVNHSCEPNCGVRLVNGEVVLIAIAVIAPSDEITYDYSTATLDNGKTTMNCLCGASCCRKIIGDFKDLPNSVKQRYLQLGVVLPFANK